MNHKPVWCILLIDDDEDDYFLVKDMLSEARGTKFVLDWASNYDKGRLALTQGIYDAVLTDYDLGAQTGIDIICEFSAHNYPAPFILLTGRGSYEVDVEAMHAGATVYLTKSEVNSLLLERSIRYAIEHKQIQADLESANRGLMIQQKDLEQQNIQLKNEIAERKRVEEALRDQEASLRAILNATTESIWLFDPDGVILLGNDIALARMKRPTEEIIGVNFHNMMPSELAESRYQRLREVVETGMPLEFEDVRAGILFHHNFAPVKDSTGKTIAVAAFSRDITHQRMADNALRLSEERFRGILQNSLDMIYQINLQTQTYDYISPSCEQVIGYKPEEMMAMTLEQAIGLIHPDDLEDVLRSLEQANQTGQMKLEYRLRDRDGQYRWISNHLVVRKDGQGRPLYRSAVVRNITEQKKSG